jgi:glyoxylase-like metal-dependent hydrolase (beta-lactamase superfamily II)
MTDEVAPGVWWLSGTRGCNVYLVRADDGSYVLVDAAFASAADAIVRETRAIAGDAAVTHLLLTHHHGDHTGAANEVARRLGATITAGADDCEELAGRRVLRSGPAPRGPLELLFRRRRESPERVEVGCALEGSVEVSPGVVAHPVPGHTPGSYCYVARAAGVSFVGDLVIGHRSGLSRSLAGANSDDEQYSREMLEFALEHATDIGCPGHGYPSRGFAGDLEALAREPREPWTLRNTPGRLWRLFAFTRYVWRRRR